jgi:hypothetical protein
MTAGVDKDIQLKSVLCAANSRNAHVQRCAESWWVRSMHGRHVETSLPPSHPFAEQHVYATGCQNGDVAPLFDRPIPIHPARPENGWKCAWCVNLNTEALSFRPHPVSKTPASAALRVCPRSSREQGGRGKHHVAEYGGRLWREKSMIIISGGRGGREARRVVGGMWDVGEECVQK